MPFSLYENGELVKTLPSRWRLNTSQTSWENISHSMGGAAIFAIVSDNGIPMEWRLHRKQSDPRSIPDLTRHRTPMGRVAPITNSRVPYKTFSRACPPSYVCHTVFSALLKSTRRLSRTTGVGGLVGYWSVMGGRWVVGTMGGLGRMRISSSTARSSSTRDGQWKREKRKVERRVAGWGGVSRGMVSGSEWYRTIDGVVSTPPVHLCICVTEKFLRYLIFYSYIFYPSIILARVRFMKRLEFLKNFFIF